MSLFIGGDRGGGSRAIGRIEQAIVVSMIGRIEAAVVGVRWHGLSGVAVGLSV